MKQIIAIAILTLFTTASFSQTPDPFPKRIQVTGSAEMDIIPDEIYVIVTLKEYEKKGTGKIDLEKVKTEFLNNCRSIGLPDSAVTIASYEGSSPRPWWRKKRDKDELYATIAYQVKFSNSKKIDELVMKLDDDATQNFQVARVSHSKIQEYRKQVKIQAIKAAKEKAVYLAEAIGEKPGEAVSITELEEGNVIPYDLPAYNTTIENFKLDAVGEEKYDAGVDFKKIKLKMRISAVFAIK